MRRKSSVQSVMAGEVDDGPTVETWSDKNQRIEVSEPRQGFLYDLILRAKVGFVAFKSNVHLHHPLYLIRLYACISTSAA